ncbi:hypothetical protein F4808DRAFT_197992 [Astrocystis sublimbata]|nr:hypothetical protein F4808DRAFT_197992 [Astrocystis sublimbata]
MSHSKRNTSRAVFTSYERELARQSWTSTSARLTRDSYLPFSACRLCLESAIEPVSCVHGDIFCRECALSNILAQKKEIKRVARLQVASDGEAQEQRARLEAEAHERAVREFEMTQSGLDARVESTSTTTPTHESRDKDTDTDAPEQQQHQRPGKRKFELDASEVSRIAASDRAKARKAIDAEKAAEPHLPSFWVPSVTPSSNTRDALHDIVKKVKTSPICPASAEDRPHTYSLHTLVSVRFTEEGDDDDKTAKRSTGGVGGGKTTTTHICPSCKKGLSNSSKATLAKPCGHVVCGSCVAKFMKSSHRHDDPHATEAEQDALRCYVCDADLTEHKNKAKKEGGGKKDKEKEKEKIRPGLVELRSEGTGYSAGGANQVRKSGVAAFQC